MGLQNNCITAQRSDWGAEYSILFQQTKVQQEAAKAQLMYCRDHEDGEEANRTEALGGGKDNRFDLLVFEIPSDMVETGFKNCSDREGLRCPARREVCKEHEHFPG